MAEEVGVLITDVLAPSEPCEHCGTRVVPVTVEYYDEPGRRRVFWEIGRGGTEHTPARCRAFRAANGQGSRRD